MRFLGTNNLLSITHGMNIISSDFLWEQHHCNKRRIRERYLNLPLDGLCIRLSMILLFIVTSLRCENEIERIMLNPMDQGSLS